MRRLPTISVKSQIANIFSFTSHVVFVITAQFCHCNVKAATGDPHANEHGCVQITHDSYTWTLITYGVHVPQNLIIPLIFSNHLKMSKLIHSLYINCARTDDGLDLAQGLWLPVPILEVLWQETGRGTRPCQPDLGVRETYQRGWDLNFSQFTELAFSQWLFPHLEHRFQWPIHWLQG